MVLDSVAAAVWALRRCWPTEQMGDTESRWDALLLGMTEDSQVKFSSVFHHC